MLNPGLDVLTFAKGFAGVSVVPQLLTTGHDVMMGTLADVELVVTAELDGIG